MTMPRTATLIAAAALTALVALPGCGSRQKLTAVEA